MRFEMTAKNVLMRPKGLRHGARAPTCLPLFKAISTGIRIYSFMYLIFLCLLLKKIALLFCPAEARETTQIFSRTFQDSKKNPRLSRMWQVYLWYYLHLIWQN